MRWCTLVQKFQSLAYYTVDSIQFKEGPFGHIFCGCSTDENVCFQHHESAVQKPIFIAIYLLFEGHLNH